MKILNGQNRQFIGRPSAVTVRRTLRKLSDKNISDASVAWKDKFRNMLTVEKPIVHFRCRANKRLKRDLKISNDATSTDSRQQSKQVKLLATPDLTPATLHNPSNTFSPPHSLSLDTGGFSPIMLLAHPAAIVYITSCRQDNQTIYVSPQIAKLGFSPEACFGKPDMRLQRIYEEDSGFVTKAFMHSCSTGESFSCHYRLYDSKGNVRWFHDEASVVCDEAGAPLFIRGVMLDITDKKEMEVELAKHRYYLELNVEQRTAQLVKRMSVLESCNSALCDKLALARKHLASLNQQLHHTLPESVLAEINLPDAA